MLSFSRYVSPFMERRRSLSYSKEPATVLCICIVESISTLTKQLIDIHFNIILSSKPRSSKWLLPLMLLY
jgi:hypothetical protein